jgi:hypothetical protein
LGFDERGFRQRQRGGGERSLGDKLTPVHRFPAHAICGSAMPNQLTTASRRVDNSGAPFIKNRQMRWYYAGAHA